MNNFFVFLLGGITAEAVVEIIKGLKTEGKINTTVLMSIIVGIILAFTMNIDIFKMFEIEAAIPYIGNIVSGLIISRGSNYVADFVELINSISYKNEVSVPQEVEETIE